MFLHQLFDQVQPEPVQHVGMVRNQQDLFAFPLGSFMDALLGKHCPERTEETLEVHQERDMFCIVAVQFCLAADFQFIPAVDLGPAGQPRQDIVGPVLIPFRNQIFLVVQGRPRADDTHVTFEDIDQLRQFIQTGFPQEPAGFGYKPLRICQQVRRHIFRGIGIHRPELQDIELCFMNTDTALPEKNRARTVQFDPDHQNHKKGQQNQQPYER